MSVADYDYGLEDKLLRKNIPGRYSTWEDEEPERRARDEDDSDDIDQSQRDEIALTSNCSEEPSLSRTDGPQTGSKGVLADYREHCRLESEARQEDQAEALNAWRQAAYGSTSTPVPETSNKVDGDVDSELATLRRRRLQEIQATREIKPVFGQVREVNPMEMLSAIDDEDQRVCVVVHLYDGRVHACQTMSARLQEVAHAQPRLKVLQMPAKDAPNGAGALDGDTMPVLVLYRGGELIASLVRCTDQLGPFYTATDVENLLYEHGALNLIPNESNVQAATSNREVLSSDQSDSDTEGDLGVD